MVKQFNAKSTKNEILDAYNDLASENSDLTKEINKLKKEADALRKENKALESETSSRSDKVEIKQVVKVEKTEEKMSTNGLNYTVASIINELKRLRPGFGKAVSELSDKLTSEAAILEQLHKTSNTESERLKTLYQIEISGETLEQLIKNYQEKSQTFDEELKTKQTNFETEIREKRISWQKEQDEHNQSVKERDSSNKKAQDREQQEYVYKLTQARNLDKDAYEQQKKQLEKELTELKDTREKEWLKREEALAQQEKQYDETKTKVEEFPRELEAAIKKAKQEGNGIAYHQAKVKADLTAKEAEGKKRVYELRIQSLEDTINKQVKQITELSSQLTTVLKQGQELAVKAIEGASSKTSFQAVREIAIEQAKNQQKNK
ncbi:MAG: hypothetical protein HY819_02605 [Acidobacteria bacterium]|nr:hypothetical protein [Acidobacteriota bacterium]